MWNGRRPGWIHFWKIFTVGTAFPMLMFCGCHEDMYDQPKLKPYRAEKFFRDSLGMRLPVEGTVSHGRLQEDSFLLTGKVGGEFANTFPFQITKQVLSRGKERFEIFCSPCHGRVGDGHGMIVQRGFPAPPSFHTDSLRDLPAGLIADVITHGFGRMYPYADRVRPSDRWAIVAYIRALQFSQHAPVSAVPMQSRGELR